MSARAAVLTERGRIEVREFELPTIGEDDALLEVEASGTCGSDVEQFAGALEDIGVGYPTIPGHEPVGRISRIGAGAARRWQLAVGDRVAVEPLIGCGHCRSCRLGNYNRCQSPPNGTRVNSYGYVPTTTSPALWGGFAEYLYLHPMSILHRIADHLPIELAVLYQPMASGVRWFAQRSGLRIGDSVAILGCGQRGLTGTIAAREGGASQIIVTGLAADKHKLELARTFGADHTIVADEQDVVARVAELTGGVGVDVVVDVSAYATAPIVDAIEIAKPGATIVLAGLKGFGRTVGLASDRIVTKELTIKGAAASDITAFEPALRLLGSGRYPLELMHTHTFGLDGVGEAIDTLAGRVPGQHAINIMIDPRL